MTTVQSKNRHLWYRLDIALGITGMFLPLIAWLLGKVFYQIPLQPSLSDYYYTPIGWFHTTGLVLFSIYFVVRPWTSKRGRLIGLAIAVCTILTVLFPAPECIPSSDRIIRSENVTGQLHLMFAGMLFLAFTFMTFFHFGKEELPSDGPPTRHLRTAPFKWLGSLMLLCSVFIVGIGVLGDTCNTPANSNTAIFWFEVLALSSFWVAWLLHHKLVVSSQ